MAGKGYAFVTFASVPTAQAFLEVRRRVCRGDRSAAGAVCSAEQCERSSACLFAHSAEQLWLGACMTMWRLASLCVHVPRIATVAAAAAIPTCAQHREHYIDGRKVDAKAAVPRDQGGGKLTRKMFVGGLGEVSDGEFLAHFANFGAVVVRGVGGAGRLEPVPSPCG